MSAKVLARAARHLHDMAEALRNHVKSGRLHLGPRRERRAVRVAPPVGRQDVQGSTENIVRDDLSLLRHPRTRPQIVDGMLLPSMPCATGCARVVPACYDSPRARPPDNPPPRALPRFILN